MSNCEPKRTQKLQFIDNLLHSRDVRQTKELYSQWAYDYDEVSNSGKLWRNNGNRFLYLFSENVSPIEVMALPLN